MTQSGLTPNIVSIWIEERCRIPEGRDVGQKVQLTGLAEGHYQVDL